MKVAHSSGTVPPDSAIRPLARELRERIEEAGARQRPITVCDVERIGIRVQLLGTSGDVEGRQGSIGGRPTITLFRSREPDAPLTSRERFTLAHELGHFLLRERNVGFGGEDEERWCDAFAAELLLPDRDLEAAGVALGRLARGDDALCLIKRLARARGVSLTAAGGRLVDCGVASLVGISGGQREWRISRGMPKRLAEAAAAAVQLGAPTDSQGDTWRRSAAGLVVHAQRLRHVVLYAVGSG